MFTLKEGDKIGRYSVCYLIKNNRSNSTYKVSREDGSMFLMKFFDMRLLSPSQILNGEVTEIVFSRRIFHPHVTSYVDDGTLQYNGAPCAYLITEFHRGYLLTDYLSLTGKIQIPEAITFTKCILAGLEHIHSLNLNHNDLCPQNVILQIEGPGIKIPKIIDFGHLCPPTTGVAPFPLDDLNLLFCAPENWKGIYREKADVFSVAAILYTLITGGISPWHCDLEELRDYTIKRRLVQMSRVLPLDLELLRKEGCEKPLVELIAAALYPNEMFRISLSEFISRLNELKDSHLKDAPDSHEDNSHQEEITKPTELNVEVRKAWDGGFADVAGMDQLKEELRKRIIWLLQDKEKAKKYRLSAPNGMLLYGPPGCGKTYFSQKFAEETHFNFILVNGSDLGSIFIHGTQGKIAELFKKAEQNAPCILCFDEFDSFVPSRDSMTAQNRPDEVNEFLSQLNNCSERGIFVIGTTNRKDLIDPAVLRKGRMDLQVEIPAPDEASRASIFALHLKGRPLDPDIDTEELARQTPGYAAADIAFIVNEAAMMAALADVPISQLHLLNAVKSNPSSLKPDWRNNKIGF